MQDELDEASVCIFLNYFDYLYIISSSFTAVT